MVTKVSRDVLDVAIRPIVDGFDVDGTCSASFTMDGINIGSSSPCSGSFTSLVSTDLTVTGAIDIGGTIIDDINMGSNRITFLADPVLAQDAATKAYVDSATPAGGPFLPISGGTMGGVISMGSNKITSAADPTLAQDVATKAYVDTEVASVVTSIGEIVQIVHNPVTTFISSIINYSIPRDNTIPQSSEGFPVTLLDTTITPTNAGNLLKIEVFLSWSNSGVNSVQAIALFQDAGVNAIATTWDENSPGPYMLCTNWVYYMTAGTTLPTTFKINVGNLVSVGVIVINGDAQFGAPSFGGTMVSHMTITEMNV